MEKTKTIIIFIFLSFIAANAFASKIVAFVNNEVITDYDVTAYISMNKFQLEDRFSGKELEEKLNEVKSQALDNLIEDKLIISLARKMGMMIKPEYIQQRIDEIRNRFPNEAEFEKHLSKSGFSRDDLYKRIEQQLLTMEMINQQVRSKIYISPREVTEFYAKHAQEFMKQEMREVLALRLGSKQEVNRAMALLNTKVAFTDVQKEFNSEINLGFVGKDTLKDDLEKAIFSLNEKEFSQPIKQEDEFYIFYIDKIEPSRSFTLKEAQAQIRDIIWRDKMEIELSEWIKDLKSKAKIVIND